MNTVLNRYENRQHFAVSLGSRCLLDLAWKLIRFIGYGLRTEESYVHWNRLFIRLHGLRHPAETSGAEAETCLSCLANSRGILEKHISSLRRSQRVAAIRSARERPIEKLFDPAHDFASLGAKKVIGAGDLGLGRVD